MFLNIFSSKKLDVFLKKKLRMRTAIRTLLYYHKIRLFTIKKIKDNFIIFLEQKATKEVIKEVKAISNKIKVKQWTTITTN